MEHKISAEEIEADNLKVKAIMEIPEPTDKKEIERIWGMINCVAKFLPKLSEVTSPLRELLHKDVHWHRENHHKKAFNKIKELIAPETCLAFFDVSKPIAAEVDASKVGSVDVL